MRGQRIRSTSHRNGPASIAASATRSAVQRCAVGGNQADVDMVLTQPITNEVAWVQVKSRSTQAELDHYVRRFKTTVVSFVVSLFYHSAPKVLRVTSVFAVAVDRGSCPPAIPDSNNVEGQPTRILRIIGARNPVV